MNVTKNVLPQKKNLKLCLNINTIKQVCTGTPVSKYQYNKTGVHRDASLRETSTHGEVMTKRWRRDGLCQAEACAKIPS